MNHEFIDQFRELHGHSPWLICGVEADCLFNADHVNLETCKGTTKLDQNSSPNETQERNNP